MVVVPAFVACASKDILDLLATGASRETILADFPYLEDADVSAALEVAAEGAGDRVYWVNSCLSAV